MNKKLEEMDIVVFGEYGKYAFSDRKKYLCWEVRDMEEDGYLLNATELLEERYFDLDGEENTFGQSELYEWLNYEFMDKAFNDNEKKAIVRKENSHMSGINAGEVDKSYDYVTIPNIGNSSCINEKKSLRNELIEGEYKGAWLRDGINISRVACKSIEEVDSKYGLMPSEKLSVHPYLYVDKETFNEFEFIDTTDDYMNGTAANCCYYKCIFYVNGKYVKVHFDEKGEWGYIKNSHNEAILIYNEWLNDKKFDELVFPHTVDNIKVIGILGEYRCEDIKRIVIEEGIEFVGDEVLVLCPKLEEIKLPDSLKSFPGSNLVGCPNLKDIDISKNNPYYRLDDDVLYNKDKTTVVKYISRRPYQAYGCPKTVTRIEPGAFSDTPFLIEISISDAMSEIEDYTFAFVKVEQILLNDKITKIGKHAFENSQIQKISIPESVEIIEDKAFMQCECLTQITLPKTLEYLGKYVFEGCKLLTSICIPEGVTSLEGTFTNCMMLKQVYIPDSVIYIDNYTFELKQHKTTNHFGEFLNQTEFLTVYGHPGSFIEAYAEEYELSYSNEEFDNEKYNKETVYYSSLNDYLNAQIGDIVTFGSYVQRASNDVSDPIEWYVIKKENNQLMLLSKYALFEKEYDLKMNNSYNVKDNQSVEWNSSELKEYLNTIFIDEAFNDLEKECLVSKKMCSNYDNNLSIFHDKSKLDSKVFLLSHNEVNDLLNEEMRIAYRTDYNYVDSGLYRKARWWLRSIDEEEYEYSGVWYMDTVFKDGTFSMQSSNEKLSVRPAIWIDLDKVKDNLNQTNEQYIKEWLLNNNEYLDIRKDRDEFLEVLTHYVMLYEKLYEMNNDVTYYNEDYFIKEGKSLRVVSGSKKITPETEYILKLFNYCYAYLDIDFLKKDAAYYYLYKCDYLNGIIKDEEFDIYFDNWYQFINRHYRTCKFDRIVYRINNNVYYADQPLTEEEIDTISKFRQTDQRRFDVDHNDDGSMVCW